MWVIYRKGFDNDNDSWDYFQVLESASEITAKQITNHLQYFCPKYEYKYEWENL